MRRALLSALALGAFLVENSCDFVGSVPYFRRITGGLGILDMLPGPDPERVHRALDLLGPTGRQQYALLLVTFDIVFPLALALFFREWLNGWRRALPWVTLALDYTENVACGVLVATFPHESAAVAWLAGALTAAKFVGYAACVLAILPAVGSAIRSMAKSIGVMQTRW